MSTVSFFNGRGDPPATWLFVTILVAVGVGLAARLLRSGK